jgi:hypothetical protein
MTRAAILVAFCAACAQAEAAPTACPEAEPQQVWKPDSKNSSHRFLYKRWHEDTALAGERFLTGELANDAICLEVAEVYNRKPSVVSAAAVTFECGVTP